MQTAPVSDPYRIGRFYFHTGEPERARPWLQQACFKKPLKAERWGRWLLSYLPRPVFRALTGSRRRVWHELWESALAMPPHPTAHETAMAEMAEYLNISVEETRKRCDRAAEALAEAWRSNEPKSGEEITKFYENNTDYIGDLVLERTKPYEFGGHHAVEAALFSKARGLKRSLDFGSGDGTTALLFAHQGFQAGLADVNKPLLEFARWRFNKRGLKADYYLMSETKLPENYFEVVTAFDTFEHLAHPEKALKTIYQALASGGFLVANIPFGPTPDHPMHLPHDPKKFLAGARAAGFQVKPFTLKEFFLFQKQRI